MKIQVFVLMVNVFIECVKFVLVPFDLAVSVCYNCVDERVMTLNDLLSKIEEKHISF